jgi:hypothetical protein
MKINHSQNKVVYKKQYISPLERGWLGFRLALVIHACNA